MTGDWKTGRAAEYAAMALLQKAGYYTEKISGGNRRFDIIAWKDGKPLCLVIRSSKRHSISSFPEQLATMADLVRARIIPGEIQFWIYRRPGWSMYKIQPGGATPITWSDS